MQIAAWFSPKIQSGMEGRKYLLANLEMSFLPLTKGRPVAWFHAASLGEFEQGRPVMESFRQKYPDYFILLTFFSPSGYEIRKNYNGADYICYLPIDTKENAERFIKAVRPKIVFFIKYEFWFNYLRELRKSDAYILSFSAIFRPGQAFFRSYGGFYRKLLTYFDYILVQNDESLSLLHKIGITKCTLAGDTRFDRVSAIADTVKELPLIIKFLNGNPCLIAGSVWEADMQELIPAINSVAQPLKVIIAPHEIKQEEIAAWRKKLSRSSVRYSEFQENIDNQSYDCLIIDNIGMLSSLYRYGNMAYVGGAFGSGLHNILEAATFGLPVIFGNKGYHKFQEANDLIKEGGALVVAGHDEIGTLLNDWYNHPETCAAVGAINKNYVLSRKGATDKVMEKVKDLLN